MSNYLLMYFKCEKIYFIRCMLGTRHLNPIFIMHDWASKMNLHKIIMSNFM